MKFQKCSAYIQRLCFVASLLPSLVVLCRDLVFINNIFSIKKKEEISEATRKNQNEEHLY
jgi:hypothetical protein